MGLMVLLALVHVLGLGDWGVDADPEIGADADASENGTASPAAPAATDPPSTSKGGPYRKRDGRRNLDIFMV